jgi:hypothetical protein
MLVSKMIFTMVFKTKYLRTWIKIILKKTLNTKFKFIQLKIRHGMVRHSTTKSKRFTKYMLYQDPKHVSTKEHAYDTASQDIVHILQ